MANIFFIKRSQPVYLFISRASFAKLCQIKNGARR